MIHIVTGEYPPAGGGVSDYSALVASALAAEGEVVQVWSSGRSGVVQRDGVTVHREAGCFTPLGLARLDRKLNRYPGPRRILVQWTPHSFGFRSLNPFFPAWLWTRAQRHRDKIEIVVHEPFLAFGEGNWRQDVAAALHRGMVFTLLHSASKVWITIPAWEERLRPWCSRKHLPFEWLPVPSNIALQCEPRSILAIRASLTSHRLPLIGHFGTFRPDIARLIEPAMLQILKRSNANVLLAGTGSEQSCERLLKLDPSAENRIVFTGPLGARSIAEHLSSCDALLQPYPDGISSRRGTAMAALSLGLPMVTNLGHLSEDFWKSSGAVRLASSSGPEALALAALLLVQDRDARLQISGIARDLYQKQFSAARTISALLRQPLKAPLNAGRAVA